MIGGTGSVQQDHTSHEDRHRQEIFHPDWIPALTNSGTAAKTAIIMAIKCVMALPGSLMVICIITPPFPDSNCRLQIESI